MTAWKLKEVDQSEYLVLRDRLEKHMPASCTVYGTLTTCMAFDILDKIPTRYFIPSDPVNADDTCFTLATPACDLDFIDQTLMFYWEDNKLSDDNLVQLLLSLPDWDWNKAVCVYSCYLPLMKQFERAMKDCRLQVNNSRLTLWPVHTSRVYVIDKKSMRMKPRLPAGYEFRRLKEENLEFIYLFWDYPYMSGIDGIKKMVKYLPSVGVFKIKDKFKSTEANTSLDYGTGVINDETKFDKGIPIAIEQPVSWTLIYRQGCAGVTYTLPQYRRQGLCSATVLELARQYFNKASVLTAEIDKGNGPVIKLLDSLKCVSTIETGLHIYLPSGKTPNDLNICF